MTTLHPSPSTAPSARHTSFTFKAAAFAVPLVISMAIFVVVFRARVREVAQIEKQLEFEKERGEKLAAVALQNADYQRLLEDLERRINTIQALQNSRTGPVEFMRAVGKLAMQTADVDLYSFTPQDRRCVFRGRSHSVEAMARFLASLQSSRSFSEVHLREFYRDSGQNSTTYRFEFDCAYVQSPR
jgi:Tfp pilus assembly protein PilN